VERQHACELVDDELWEIVSPLLPLPPHKTPAGRKRLDERRVFIGILFILQSGFPWEFLPQEMGCGSGMTCWRRARDWQKAGVWNRLHRILLAKLRNALPIHSYFVKRSKVAFLGKGARQISTKAA
jgi:transposase